MRCMFVAALLAVASAAPQFEAEFASFKKSFGKKYATAAEHAERFAIFSDNSRWFREQNALGHSWSVGVGPFADLTEAEFKQRWTSPTAPGARGPAPGSSYLGAHVAAPDEQVRLLLQCCMLLLLVLLLLVLVLLLLTALPPPSSRRRSTGPTRRKTRRS